MAVIPSQDYIVKPQISSEDSFLAILVPNDEWLANVVPRVDIEEVGPMPVAEQRADTERVLQPTTEAGRRFASLRERIRLKEAQGVLSR